MATTTPEGVRGSHAAKHGGAAAASAGAPMSHRQIMEALSGLLLGMFAAIISSTIVSNALPKIIGDLGGGQSAYTWVVTASLLTMTASTPLWGKLADLYNKKALVQIALVIFAIGSVVAGLSQDPAMLIACRAVQGIGAGGLAALAQIIMAAMIAPRERGRYSGYLGATFAVATVGGPLLGGVITDTSWLGWRWCFYVGVPFALIALVVLQKTLKLPVVKRDVKVDWLGAFFVVAAVCLLLIWVTFAGDKYDWMSWQTGVMVGGSIVLALIFILVESKATEPIMPLRLFRNRTITLASLASLFVGIAMFSGTVFFSQYFQLARGESPTMSGVMTIPMIAGIFVSSTASGIIITKNGRWKAWLVSGAVLLTAGLGLLGSIRYDTPYWHIALFMALMGLGVGMMMQNLVLCTQNQVAPSDLGSASSVVTFFRSLGGAVGVSALGAVMATKITDYVTDGLTALGPKAAAAAQQGGGSSGGFPDLDAIAGPDPDRLRVGLRPRCRGRLPDRRPDRGPRPDRRDLHQGGPAADPGRPGPDRERGRADRPGPGSGRGPRPGRRRRRHRGDHRARHRRRPGPGVRDGPARLERHHRPRHGPGRGGGAGGPRHRHADLARRPPARPRGRPGRRVLRAGRPRARQLRADRLGRRLPAAGQHRGGGRAAARLRHPAQRDQRPDRHGPCRERRPGRRSHGDRHRRARRRAGHRCQ